ncbi:universal stress protein [Microvirga roseola]|uniref:universal stress protein n=1 Tax=Microvirga roseola TaxID=2883126 RepID=UPI001E523603|nr:universal stress protein [Microvirga roseola]
MFALLGIARDQAVHVLSVDIRSEKDAVDKAVRASALLERHGYASVHPIGLGNRDAGGPSEAILGTAKALQACMIVMGAYGHSGIREIFGSCTRQVLSNSTKMLFLHH